MRPIFEYTSTEMQKKVDNYFNECEENGKLPTIPGLCLVLGITPRRYNSLLKAYNASASNEIERKDRKSLQLRHLKVLETARMRMCDALEQRTDAMSMFKLKQLGYAGYTDKPETKNDGGVNVTINLKGISKDVNPGG